MSLEAWGDDDGAGDYDHLLDAGWWPSEQASAVTEAIEALGNEQFYQNGKIAEGVATRFLARITLLKEAAGLFDSDAPLVIEAKALLANPK